jgi:hypothetical protein
MLAQQGGEAARVQDKQVDGTPGVTDTESRAATRPPLLPTPTALLGQLPPTAAFGLNRRNDDLAASFSRAQHVSALRDDEDDNGVVSTLRGMHGRPAAGRSSHWGRDIDREQDEAELEQAEFNPLADDLNDDFSNPLAAML